MGINRFTNLTPSAYKPMTLQEILMTPLAMRQKHDDLLAKQELIRSQLGKVDPHSKYFNEANELKKNIQDKIDQQALELSKNGFTSDSNGKIISLNREVQDLFSPTGKLGMINQHNIEFKKELDDLEKQAIQQKWSEKEYGKQRDRAIQYHMMQPKWDNQGRYIPFKNPFPAPTRIDYYDEFDKLAKNAKVSTSELSGARSIYLGTDNSGYNVEGLKKWANKTGNNYNAVKDALDTFKLRLNNSNDPLYKSAVYEGLNPNDIINILDKQSGVYKQNVSEKNNEFTTSHFGQGPSSDDQMNNSDLDTITDPNSTKTIGGGENKVDFSGIGSVPFSTQGNSTYDLSMGISRGSKRKTYKDVISDPLQQKMYENIYKKSIKEGKIDKNRSINDPKVASYIQNYINNIMPPVTLSDKEIITDIVPNNNMFANGLKTKDSNQRNNYITKSLSSGHSTLIDPITKKPLTYDEFKDKGYEVEYIGYDSPLNFRGYKFNNHKQQVMAHKVLVYKKEDGERKLLGKSAVSRTNEEMNTPEFRASSLLTFSFRNAVLNSGEWTPLGTQQSSAKNLNGSKIKYNYNGTIDIKTPKGELYENLPTEALSEYVLRNYKE